MEDLMIQKGMTVEEVAEWQMSLYDDFKEILGDQGIGGVL